MRAVLAARRPADAVSFKQIKRGLVPSQESSAVLIGARSAVFNTYAQFIQGLSLLIHEGHIP